MRLFKPQFARSASSSPRYAWCLASGLLVVVLLAAACAGESPSANLLMTAQTAQDPATHSVSSPEPTARQTGDSVPEPSSVTAEEDPAELTVGYLLPTANHPAAHIASHLVKAIEMARDEINAAGGNVRLLPGNSEGSPEKANLAVDDQLANGVSAIIGAASSTITQAVIDKVTDAEVVLISPSATSPHFTTYDDGGYFFRTAPSDALLYKEFANMMIESGVTNAGILYQDERVWQQFAEALERHLKESGVKVSASIGFHPETIDYAADISILKEAEVDGIALLTGALGDVVIAHKIEAGVGPREVPLFMYAVTTGERLRDIDPDDPGVLEGSKVIYTSDLPEHGEPTFGDRLTAYVGEEVTTINASHAFDALVIVALASLTVGSTKATDYAGVINDITRGGTVCQTYASCAELVAAGEDIDYVGASGLLEFTDAGEPSLAGYDIFEFNSEGELELLEHVVVYADGGPQRTMITG